MDGLKRIQQATPVSEVLARWLLEHKADEAETETLGAQTASQFFENLRMHLMELIGAMVFQILFARALTQAKAEVPWLAVVSVKADGSLEGFDEAVQQQDATGASQGAIALLTHLLGLLIPLLGEDMILLQVRHIGRMHP